MPVIEVRGPSQTYAVSCAAIKFKPGLDKHVVTIGHYVSFWTAHSEDEAYGKAMKAFLEEIPSADGWHGHSLNIKRIDIIE
jgi:hypothetical protein